MEQALYQLSEGWEWSNLTDVCTPSRKTVEPKPDEKYNYIALENIESNTGRVINNIPTQGSEISSTKVGFKKGMVLYGKLRPYLNKVIVAKKNGIATTEIIPFECSEAINADFLAYFLRSQYFVDLAMNNCSGARMPRATTKLFTKIAKIPLTSIDEQKRIVEKLDKIFTRIDIVIKHFQESVALVDALFKSTLSSLVCNESTQNEKLSLEELGSFSGGGTPSKSKSEFWNGEILWVTPKDMKLPVITDSKLKITAEGVSGSSAKFIPARSILIVARSGILQHTLPVCINDTECTVNQDIKVFIPANKVCTEYVQYMLKGHESFILSELVKGGVTVESLKFKEFQNFKFPVPSLTVQQEIIKKLTSVSRLTDPLTTELNEKINYLKKLKASILDSAFKGQL